MSDEPKPEWEVEVGEDEIGPCLVVKRSPTLEERNEIARQNLWDLSAPNLLLLVEVVRDASVAELIWAMAHRPAIRKWVHQLARLKLEELLGEAGPEDEEDPNDGAQAGREDPSRSLGPEVQQTSAAP
jgi:hypothetical protein